MKNALDYQLYKAKHPVPELTWFHQFNWFTIQVSGEGSVRLKDERFKHKQKELKNTLHMEN